MTDAELHENLRGAIRETLAALSATLPDERLRGYALCTDDELVTLGCLAVTQEALDASDDGDLLFSPTDWPHEPARRAFDAASRELRTRAAVSRPERHVDPCFELLVQALLQSKREGAFADDVFLTVLSTDPSAQLERLENDAVHRLNPGALAEGWSRFLRRWA